MHAIAGRAVLIGSVILMMSDVCVAQQQNTNQKGAPSPRQAPARPQQMRPPQQMMGHPGQFVPGKRGPGGQVVLVRPGVVKGPSGSLRKSLPANIVHNPKHRIGSAGKRYNKQAFTFKRGRGFYRRFYYIGPADAIFFYDESLSENDPTMYGANVAELPTCPADSDDCQGFNDSAAMDGPDPGALASALQLVQSYAKDCTFNENGAQNNDENFQDLVSYSNLSIRVVDSGGRGDSSPLSFGRAMFGGDTLELLGMDNSGAAQTCWLLNDSYKNNKRLYDSLIIALKTLGAVVQPYREGLIDIRSVRQ